MSNNGSGKIPFDAMRAISSVDIVAGEHKTRSLQMDTCCEHSIGIVSKRSSIEQYWRKDVGKIRRIRVDAMEVVSSVISPRWI